MRTFKANPGGLKLAGLTFHNQAAQSTPFRVTVVSDGGPQSHTITAPATNTTYTAVYRKR